MTEVEIRLWLTREFLRVFIISGLIVGFYDIAQAIKAMTPENEQ